MLSKADNSTNGQARADVDPAGGELIAKVARTVIRAPSTASFMDIKPGNILLDAKGDRPDRFGLADWSNLKAGHAHARIFGTLVTWRQNKQWETTRLSAALQMSMDLGSTYQC